MISDELKVKLVSALNTFIASFLTVVGTTLLTGGIQWSWAFWAAIGIAAVRAAVKAVIDQFVPQKLGGKKR